MSIATVNDAQAAPTFWEQTAETHWGRYITGIEQQMLLAAQASFPQPHAALEIGCEGGRWCRLLANLGWQMTAVDVDPEALRACQLRSPGVHCIQVSPADEVFPVESASVDLLLCLEVPPVVNSSWFPAEAARVLKPGGRLVSTLNNAYSWRGAAVTLKRKLRGGRPFYERSFVSLRHALADHGLRVDEARGCCWAPFGRHSNSPLVPVATRLERNFGLQNLPSISPWVAYTATRTTRDTPGDITRT